jgi:hypothetical protein
MMSLNITYSNRSLSATPELWGQKSAESDSERQVIISMKQADYKHQLLNIYSWLRDFMIRQQKHTLTETATR